MDLLVSSDGKGLKYYGMVEKLRTYLHKKVDVLSMFRYFFIPQLEDATCLSLAHTSINADCPSGKAPIAFRLLIVSGDTLVSQRASVISSDVVVKFLSY